MRNKKPYMRTIPATMETALGLCFPNENDWTTPITTPENSKNAPTQIGPPSAQLMKSYDDDTGQVDFTTGAQWKTWVRDDADAARPLSISTLRTPAASLASKAVK